MLPYGRADVVDWREVGRSYFRVGETLGLEKNLSALLDLSLDLHFPLIVTSIPRRADHFEKFSWCLALRENLTVFAM